MKQWIKKVLLLDIQILTILLRKIKFFKVRNDSAVILPPTSPGSLGDEVMILSLCQSLQKKGVKKILILDENRINSWSYLNLDSVEFYSSSFINNLSDFHKGLSFIWILKNYNFFFCIGADILDGYYGNRVSLNRMNLTSIVQRIGLRCTITGFSSNQKPTKESIKKLISLDPSIRLCVRDPVSFKRLEKICEPIQVADLAFLLGNSLDTENTQNTIKWIKGQQREGRIVIGINLSSLSLFGKSDVENLILAKLSFTFNRLIDSNNLSLVFISHDFRKGDLDDSIIIQSIMEKVLIKERINVVFNRLQPQEIRAITRNLDLALSGRMHFAIACFSQGIPVISISYQGKFSGLYEFFGLQELEISSWNDQFDLCDQIYTLISTVINNRYVYKNRIKSTLPSIISLAEKNLMLQNMDS